MYLAYVILSICFKFIICIVYKFCVNELNSFGRSCQAIQKGNTMVICVPVADSADCAIKLQRKEADFGLFTAEESLLAAKFINDDVRVVGHIRNTKSQNESFAFQTVVVVRENFNGGFPGLQSMNYCHPGFGDGQIWSDRVLKEFEKAVVPRTCHEDYPSVHQEIYSIAHFFKSACRPGDWALDDLLDQKLKKKFSTLCSLCDIPSRCAYNEELQGTHISALKCLTANGGDVAYVALKHVKEYFGMIPGFPALANVDEFKFLCPNGITQPLNQPCAWIKQPWPVVVAVKDKAPLIATQLPDFICKGPNSNCRGTWKEAFTFILQGTSNTFISNNIGDTSLLDNIKEGRSIPREWEGDACKRSVRWCTTTTDEYDKCEWLKQAVIAQDFEPRLSCVQSSSVWSCFDLINKKQADIIGIDNNIVEGNYLIVPVVKKENQNIKSLGDLKGMKACFPEYNGLVWNAFIAATVKQNILPDECPKIKAVSSFFKVLCVPGATDRDHKDYNISNSLNNICSLCAKKTNTTIEECEATSNNKYYGDLGAFSCLKNNVSDVSFVDLQRLLSKDNKDYLPTSRNSDYLIICANGTLIPFTDISQVDKNCALATGIRGLIVSRKSASKAERRDITDLLLKMDDKFGEAVFGGYDSIIQMYGAYKGKKGLLLKDTTVDFVVLGNQNNDQASYFSDLKSFSLENKRCEEKHNGKKSNSAPIRYVKIYLLSLPWIAIYIGSFI